MLNVGGTVTVFHSPGHNPETFSSDSVHDWPTVRQEVDAPDDQHAAVVYKPVGKDEGRPQLKVPLDSAVWTPASLCSHPPFLGIVNAHAKLPRACFHAPADHEAVSWLEDMKRTRHGGVSHGAHKDRHILCQTVEKETFWSGPYLKQRSKSTSDILTQKALWPHPREF